MKASLFQIISSVICQVKCYLKVSSSHLLLRLLQAGVAFASLLFCMSATTSVASGASAGQSHAPAFWLDEAERGALEMMGEEGIDPVGLETHEDLAAVGALVYYGPQLYQVIVALVGAITVATSVHMHHDEMQAALHEGLWHIQEQVEELIRGLTMHSTAAVVEDADDLDGVEEEVTAGQQEENDEEEDIDQVIADIKVQSVLWGMYNSSLNRHKKEKKEKLEKRFAEGKISSEAFKEQSKELEKTAEMAGKKLQEVEKAFMGLLDKLGALQKKAAPFTL